MSRVVVAMSGGVDSSVAAGILKEQGHEVIGISLQLHDFANKTPKTSENKFGTCCSLEDLNDARTVARKLGIPFYLSNMEAEFKKGVIDNFVEEYMNGRTPNPCVRCNEKVKFHTLMDWAMDLGADYLATGHYAQISPVGEEFALRKGADFEKDQSYFLFTIKSKDLAKTLFPVGNLNKPQVRAIAERLGLANAFKADSQDVCFVQSKSYSEFVENAAPKELLKRGNVIDLHGKVLGQHQGLHKFTVGQRKGLGVNSLEALFVVKLDPETNDVIVGPETALFTHTCVAEGFNWLTDSAGLNPKNLFGKIRYRAKEMPVALETRPDGRWNVSFETAQRAITPGQALVLYEGDRVVGGGWIYSSGAVSQILPSGISVPHAGHPSAQASGALA